MTTFGQRGCGEPAGDSDLESKCGGRMIRTGSLYLPGLQDEHGLLVVELLQECRFEAPHLRGFVVLALRAALRVPTGQNGGTRDPRLDDVDLVYEVNGWRKRC